LARAYDTSAEPAIGSLLPKWTTFSDAYRAVPGLKEGHFVYAKGGELTTLHSVV
jgi:hypothetical protein